MAASDHANEALRVYPSRTADDGGWWCAAYGDLKAPQGWEFLPAGDAFVTQQVKRAGPHWVVVRARKGYTETLGILAPPSIIKAACSLAEETATRRKQARARSGERRLAQEQTYRKQFVEAVLRYLDFAPRHSALTREIADGAAQQATAVGSGRVGRTSKLTLEAKAELAARAYIRHNYTRYEERMAREGLFEVDSFVHHTIKEQAQEEVDQFLERHRRKRGPRASSERSKR
ncbi:MAG: DUF2293 domain-containing protein [Chloroflexota bacterium]|nr:DUF2293 domain-containing protein [Chloroflexota bacterium]